MHVHSAREPVHAVANLAADDAPLLGGSALERFGPLEPCEVGLEMLRRHALETVYEVLETGVQAVYAVDGMLGRVRTLRCRSETLEDGGVGTGPIGDDESALADSPVQHLVGAFLAEHAATGHHEEGHAHIVDAGDDAHLLLVQAALRILPAALAGGAQHDPCLPLIASSSPTDVPGAGGPGRPRDLATSLRSAPRLEARPCPPDPPESSTPALSLLRVANPSHTRTQSPIFGALSG